jgi:hypothetical protein
LSELRAAHRTIAVRSCGGGRAEGPFSGVICAGFHGVEDDPVFNYANQTALELFEMSWEQFTILPSRHSAEPASREERARLLAQVSNHGYIDNYAGVRISSSGRRFLIEDAVVWNLIDDRGSYHGQAAVFDKWSYL